MAEQYRVLVVDDTEANRYAVGRHLRQAGYSVLEAHDGPRALQLLLQLARMLPVEAARIEAQRQQLYLETIAQPNLADYPLYPKRIVCFVVVFASCLVAYGIAWLLVANVREHASA